MSSQSSDEIPTNDKKGKPRRAERQIYRPGALRQLKEISQTPTGPLNSEQINNETLKKKAELKSAKSDSASSKNDTNKDMEKVNLKPSKEKITHSQKDESNNKIMENKIASSEIIVKNNVYENRAPTNNFRSKNKPSPREDSYYYNRDSYYKQANKDDYHKMYPRDYKNSFNKEFNHKANNKGKSYQSYNNVSIKANNKKENYSCKSAVNEENHNPTKIVKEENFNLVKIVKKGNENTVRVVKDENRSKENTKETYSTRATVTENSHRSDSSNKEGSFKEKFHNQSEYKKSKKIEIERYKPKQYLDKNISKFDKNISKFSLSASSSKSAIDIKISNCETDVDKSKRNTEISSNKKEKKGDTSIGDKKVEIRSNSFVKNNLNNPTNFRDSDNYQLVKKDFSKNVIYNEAQKNNGGKVKENSRYGDEKINKKENINESKMSDKKNQIFNENDKGSRLPSMEKSKKNWASTSFESSKYIDADIGGPLSEDAVSENEEPANERKKNTVNPMLYIEYKESSFFGNSHKNKTGDKTSHIRTPQHPNASWSDEKWSPSQRQKKKKNRNINKDFGHAESPGRRGIIQINNTSSNMESHTETAVPGQRLLFNPNNPSKPLAVIPSARDLPPSWDNSSGGEKQEETQSGLSSNSTENTHDNEGSGTLDPSLFYSIQKGELDINYFVNSNQLPQEFKRIMDIRLHLQGCYKQLLITDIRLCQEKNVEGALWKSLYYIIIEKLREYINREPTLKDRSLSTLMMIVEEGLNYFQSLLGDIQKAYKFSLDAHFEEDLTTLPGTKNRVRHALYSCQKIILSMGDLARYREQYNSNPNYIHAKKWYEMALQVNPKNGRPFNQLAIIAVSQKRSLDVVYYYIRSLTASNPFTSARDSLISMFDDIRRKYESMNKIKHSSEKSSRYDDSKYEEEESRRRNGSLRQEIWIRPDSGATNKRTLSQSDPEEEKKARIEELLKVPLDQLMKQFLTSYLHCHGMLFSRVGLDHFNDVLGETLSIFQALLQTTPPKLSSTHLLQILAINMFAVDNTQLRDCRIESSYRSAAQDLALLLAQEMFSRLAEVMVKLFPSCLNYTVKDGGPLDATVPKDEGGSPPGGGLVPPCVENQRLFQPPLTIFIPAAKIWCDWLLYQSSVWNPPPVSHDISGVDTWGVIGELATIVKGIGPPDVTLTEESMASFSTDINIPITLPEDLFLRGYVHIVNAQAGGYYGARCVNKERAQDWIRVKKLQLCLSQFLCGVEPPVLRLQKTDQGEILVAVVAVSPPDSPAVARSSVGSSELDFEDSNSDKDGSNSEDEGDLGSPPVEVGGEDTPLASTVRLLARRKKQLEKRQKQQRKMQAILEGAVTLEMEVKPRYLVPDTNCFIEKLNIIKTLVESTSYTFMVPLIVLVELEGLSKDAAVEKYGDVAHAVNVREGAATALHYVQSNKNPHLKCVTSQGSVAPANMFSLEMDTLKDITNDDKILSCCLHLCSDSNKRRPIKEGVRRLHREVVLLTEDRNLRVKAYARDVPVRELSDFAHWAGVK